MDCNLPPIINLKHEEEYYLTCCNTNLRLLKNAVQRKILPTRSQFISHLPYESYRIPSELMYKIYDVALHIFNLIFLDKKERNVPISICKMINLVSILFIEFSLVFTLTIVKIWAAIGGIMIPKWGISAAIIAEKGESYSYKLWAQFVEETALFSVKTPKVYEEIIPTNAFHYLGSKNMDLLRLKENNALDEDQLRKNILSLIIELKTFLDSKNGNSYMTSMKLMDEITKKEDLTLNELEIRFLCIRSNLLQHAINKINDQYEDIIREYVKNISSCFSSRRFGMVEFPHSINSFTVHPCM